MKTLCFLTALLLLATVNLAGEIPETMSYQGVLTDTEGNPVPDGGYDLTFTLYDALTEGTALWTETQTVPVADGMFHVILGSGTPLDLAFDRPYWLGVQIGDDPELTPRIELTSSAYSLNARGVLGDTNVFPSNDNVGIGTTEPSEMLEVVGTVHSTTGGFKFPDGTVQTTATTGSTGDGHSLDAPDGDPTDALYVGNEGNVYVGAPYKPGNLTVQGNVYSDKGFFDGGLMIGDHSPQIAFVDIASDGYGNLLRIGTDLDELGNVDKSLFIVKKIGNVGIGTKYPQYNLHLASEDSVVLVLEDSGASADQKMKFIKSDGGYLRFGQVSDDNIFTPQMSITPWGTVGIGDLHADQYKLLVNSHLYFGGGCFYISNESNSENALYTVTSGTGNVFVANHIGSSGNIAVFGSEGEDKIVIDHYGNMGIGTNSPDEMLTVAGTIQSTTGGFKFPDGTLQTTAATGGAGDNYSLDAADGNPVDALYVDNDGQVGIGTTNPQRHLHLANPDHVTLVLEDTGAPADQKKKFINVDDGGLRFGKFDDAWSFTPQMTIDNDGNVGIGTTNPQYALHVLGSATDGVPAIYGAYPQDWNYGIGVKGRGNSTGVLGEAFHVQDQSHDIFGVKGTADGGHHHPSEHFGVYGSATGGSMGDNYGVYGHAAEGSINYAVYADGDLAYTGDLLSVSDAKFKRNIRTYEEALPQLMRLETRRFEFDKSADYKQMNLSEGEHFGFIAQELEQVFPELVVEAVHPGLNDKKNDLQGEPVRYKAVKMMELIPILVQAIQEQQRTIEDLQAQVARLRSE